MIKDCVFCKIISKELPTELVMESDDLIIIKDRAPKASIHYLIIPKKHVRDLRVLEEADQQLACNMLFVTQRLAQTLPEPGDFKLVSNNGYEAGQRVFHLHFHFLSGKAISAV